MSTTATLSVYDGTITITGAPGEDTDIAHIDGRALPLNGKTEPWGEEEESLDRADALLADMGWQRAGEWSDDEFRTAPVHPTA